MSANPTRVDWGAPSSAAESGFPLQAGNRVLESLTRKESLGALLAFSDLHERIRTRRAEGSASSSDLELFQTEGFVLDEVLQLICDRALAITQADAVLIALNEGSKLVCRAAAGTLVADRGMQLSCDSEFLQDCLDSGRLLHCDDCDVDARVDLDLSRQIGARATVLVPLHGQRSRLGVLQAFSMVPYAFSDDDVRCFDLFAELVLSALRPEDQDRRINWLSNVVEEVLVTKPSVPAKATTTENKVDGFTAPPPYRAEGTSLSILTSDLAHDSAAGKNLSTTDITTDVPQEIDAPTFLPNLHTKRTTHPGLSVVMVLVAVAGLFSAGVWFGMRNRDKQAPQESRTLAPAVAQIPSPVSTTQVSDHLMDPVRSGTEAPSLPSSAENKLAVLPKITGVRHWSTPMGSTVVIDMQDQAPYEVHRLMSPERIYFDLHDTALAPELEGKTIDIGDISLTRVRVAQPVAGVTRIVLDTRDGSNFSVSMESNPNRMVVELRQSDRALATNRPNSTPGAATTSPKTLASLTIKPGDEQLRAKTGKFRIALDAGHGGWDLGTVGRKGLLEKDLVLDVTRRLGRLLQSRLGSEVIFTRNTDDYLPLDQRANFANQAQADLFVSVHANYSSSAAARGVETYYTNSFVAPGSKELEKREGANAPQLTQVALSAGELREKVDESRRLAASIQRSLHATLAANSPGIRDRGVKDSQFLVLTGTTMPSILTEISFVSSPADERNLQSDAYRQQIAEALYKGIARYEEASHHVKMAEVRTSAARR
ncbi:MAG: N-acetylmuramoyl-L-alanine amidase [Acidobacteria bacterium]|nr:N-acetylmuramoyl-L-alanine amidase [Acidobacteriota bacterium]